LSIDTTTGMSAPPMAITMWMPNSSAMTVITISGVMPSRSIRRMQELPPNQITTSRPARFSSGARQQQRLAADLAESLPKAITEPEKVTAPIRMPM
jgi:hypothetical protein